MSNYFLPIAHDHFPTIFTPAEFCGIFYDTSNKRIAASTSEMLFNLFYSLKKNYPFFSIGHWEHSTTSTLSWVSLLHKARVLINPVGNGIRVKKMSNSRENARNSWIARLKSQTGGQKKKIMHMNCVHLYIMKHCVVVCLSSRTSKAFC